MLRRKFQIALGALFRKGNSSFMSIAGLSVAFAVVMCVYSYVRWDLSHDGWHEHSDRIYRISGTLVTTDGKVNHSVLGLSMAPGLKEYFAEVEDYARLSLRNDAVFFEHNKERFKVKEAYVADQSVFDLFTFDMAYGSSQGALEGNNRVVINASLAKRIFGDVDPVGQILRSNHVDYEVSAVVADSPSNAHHKLNVLFSRNNAWKNLDARDDVMLAEFFWEPSVFTFIRLKPNSSITTIEERFGDFYKENMAKFGQAINAKFEMIATPLPDLHFSEYMNFDLIKGNRTYSYILILIGLAILITAILNYANWIIADGVSYRRSTGVRRIMGESHWSQLGQWLLNSLLLVALACVVAVMGLLFLSNMFQQYFEQYGMGIFRWGELALLSVGLVLTISVLTSFIPFASCWYKRSIDLLRSRGSNHPTNPIFPIIFLDLTFAI